MGLFDFLEMSGNYEERKVANYSEGKLVVDTCAVTDSSKPYETGITHPDYKDGDWIVVELYDTKEQALEGHDKWVKKMTGTSERADSKNLKDYYKYVFTCKKCKRRFGCDEQYKNTNKICPICEQKYLR